MIGLIIRLLLLLAVVFGIAFGLSRLWRSTRDRKALEQIQNDLLALRAALEDGLYSREEYERLRDKIIDASKAQGLEPPELPTPPHLRADAESSASAASTSAPSTSQPNVIRVKGIKVNNEN